MGFHNQNPRVHVERSQAIEQALEAKPDQTLTNRDSGLEVAYGRRPLNSLKFEN